MKLYIKYMVSMRCKMLVKEELTRLGLHYANIDLGTVDIMENHRPGIRLVKSMFGKHAVRDATDCMPDLILLDLDLPDMHGSKVLSHLLANDATSAIPVVIISADAMPRQVEKLMLAGARDYLTKPLDIGMFLQVVDEWLGLCRT
jgi:CheY-like chemotaxis protein